MDDYKLAIKDKSGQQIITADNDEDACREADNLIDETDTARLSDDGRHVATWVNGELK